MRSAIYLIIIFLQFLQYSFADEMIYVKVNKVFDGDTVQLSYNNELKRVRFLGIDCYETSKINRAYKQAYLNEITIEEVIRRGKYSKHFLQNYIGKNDIITVRLKGKDIYNRDLGILYKDGVNINNLMVEKGMCMPYKYKRE